MRGEPQLRVAIVTDMVPHYRRAFYERLHQSAKCSITLFCQSHVPGCNVPEIDHQLPGEVVRMPFVSASNARIAFQFLPMRRLWSDFDVLVFLGNPRYLSTVLGATVLRLLGKKVVIQGQFHTAGANTLLERLRLSWWSMFSTFLVYTDREAQELIALPPFRNKVAVGMNNGLDQARIDAISAKWGQDRLCDWRQKNGLEGSDLVLSCARLVEKNRFNDMIEAVAIIAHSMPRLKWCVIGSGPLRDTLVELARARRVADRIVWVGEVYEEEELAPWFLASDLLVHPGAIGLSLMHAFGYGLPVVTHDDIPRHMPEISALESGRNGLLFRYGDIQSLAKTIREAMSNRDALRSMRHECLRTVREDYNTDVMAERLIELCVDVHQGTFVSIKEGEQG